MSLTIVKLIKLIYYHKEMKVGGQGDRVVVRVLAMQTLGPEFQPQHLCEKCFGVVEIAQQVNSKPPSLVKLQGLHGGGAGYPPEKTIG